MKATDVKNIICAFADETLAYPWDNTGLIVNLNNDVNKILVALDLCTSSVNAAVDFGADMMVTHHPALFNATSRIDGDDYEQKLLIELIKNNISLYCAHTSVDACAGGINDALANALKLKNVRILPSEGHPTGLARIGELSDEMCAEEFVQYAKDALHLDCVRVSGDMGKTVKSVAHCSGAGDSEIGNAVQAGADAYLSGEIKYHSHLQSEYRNLLILECGHNETERIFVKLMSGCLQSAKDIVKYNVTVKEYVYIPYRYF